MRIPTCQPTRGIALIMVMIVIVVFGILAGKFAHNMKVETTLARNANRDTDLEWMGRSGIELAKYVLSAPSAGGQPYHALNQKWAGGPGDTNDPASMIPLDNYQLGPGTLSVKIVDLDRRFNVNHAANPGNVEVLKQALILIGVDGGAVPQLANAIVDWIDTDDDTHVGSTATESDYYLSLPVPHEAKNGPIDDLTEMLQIHGVTRGMFWGSRGGGAWTHSSHGGAATGRFGPPDEPIYPIGFVDVFSTLGAGRININTASATVLQIVPEVDETLAQAIITTRAGPDGAEGTEDDMPFRSVGELANVPGMNPMIAAQFARVFGVQSTAFDVRVQVRIDQASREYHSVLIRGPQGYQPLFLYWR